MTAEFSAVKRPAPLKNVVSFNGLVKRVVSRAPGLPGMACFFEFRSISLDIAVL